MDYKVLLSALMGIGMLMGSITAQAVEDDAHKTQASHEQDNTAAKTYDNKECHSTSSEQKKEENAQETAENLAGSQG